MFNAWRTELDTGLSTAICKDGQTTTTARIPFASGISSSNGSAAAPSIIGINFTSTGLFWASGPVLGLAVAGAEVGRLAGTNFLWGDTANINMTAGITINQGANDDEALALKSSDVAHGMTGRCETDTYARFLKHDASGGGLLIEGSSDSNVAAAVGILMTPISGIAADTTKSTGGRGILELDSGIANGTNRAAAGADGNICAIRNGGTTRFILDGDGDSHQDVGTAWTNFDSYDDITLLNALSGELTRSDDPLKATFVTWIGTHRATLEDARIVTFNADGHHFINWSRAHMLTIGAIRQLANRLQVIEQKLLGA